MNIKEAKEEMKHTLLAYHSKDAYGNYRYPVIRQRPVLLMGPPGIGKTAIMEQIAEECGVGLVSYTMTHHTRQSAIGLPRIVTRTYEDREVTITEYTLSEIIASVYACMERTGRKEGILFIDEINCVSETLAPTMLQFLQNKMFGTHKVPEGWMIVAAGNPPEYNKSVREFDIVTLDRVRTIEIEADSEVWMEYAWKQGIHGAILSYLRLKPGSFYVVKQTADKKQFVTARGWEDLSQILKSYEELGVEVTEKLVVQYLQEPEIAQDFTACYRLYRKYGTDYAIPEILSGGLPETDYRIRVSMAKQAGFSERFLLTGLLLEALNTLLEDYEKTDRRTVQLYEALKLFQRYQKDKADIRCLEDFIVQQKESLKIKREMELIPADAAEDEQEVIRQLQHYDLTLREQHISEKEQGQEAIRQLFSEKTAVRNQKKQAVHTAIRQAFAFAADCFGEEKELILLVSGLTRNRRAMEFIRANGSDAYLRYSKILLNHRSEQELQEECRRLLEKKGEKE